MEKGQSETVERNEMEKSWESVGCRDESEVRNKSKGNEGEGCRDEVEIGHLSMGAGVEDWKHVRESGSMNSQRGGSKKSCSKYLFHPNKKYGDNKITDVSGMHVSNEKSESESRNRSEKNLERIIKPIVQQFEGPFPRDPVELSVSPTPNEPTAVPEEICPGFPVEEDWRSASIAVKDHNGNFARDLSFAVDSKEDLKNQDDEESCGTLQLHLTSDEEFEGPSVPTTPEADAEARSNVANEVLEGNVRSTLFEDSMIFS